MLPRAGGDLGVNTAIALQIGLICLFLVGLLLWLDSPVGKPRDGQDCGVKHCRWMRGRR